MKAAFLVVGIDAEGLEVQEECPLFYQALAYGDAMMDPDQWCPGDEPWKSWAIWGNHPVTGEWMVLATSDPPAKAMGRPLVPA